MKQRNPSLLHVLLGQEAVYLVMAGSLFAAILFAILLVREQSESQKNQRPPIITLEENKGYYFRSGSAALTPEFIGKIRESVVPVLLDGSARYEATIVEVIGHTDEQPLGESARSTMDRRLLTFLGDANEPPPQAADNVGLGMARAAAVARILKQDPRLRDLTILPLSAGQAITVEESLAQPGRAEPQENRRRIEVRLRRPS